METSAEGTTVIENILTYVMPHSFALLPGVMNTPQARAELLAIGLQESKFEFRHQIGGPAHGFWQFERGGATKGVLEHSLTRAFALQLCNELKYEAKVDACFPALEHNDVLACCFARLLLWTVKGFPPDRGMPERGWRMYMDGWRPGKPHRETWDANFARAWTLVQP